MAEEKVDVRWHDHAVKTGKVRQVTGGVSSGSPVSPVAARVRLPMPSIAGFTPAV